MAKSVIEELVVVFSGNSKGLEKSCNKVLSSLGKINTAYKVIGSAVSLVAAKAFEASRLDRFSKGLQDNIENIQRWRYMISQTNGDTDSFNSTVKKLSDQMMSAKFTGRSPFLQGLAQLGINVRNSKGGFKTVTELLSDLSGVMGRMSQGQAMAIGKRLGLDESTIELLRRGRKELDALYSKSKNQVFLNKNEVTALTKLKIAWSNVLKAFDSVGNLLIKLLMPAIRVTTDALQNFADKLIPAIRGLKDLFTWGNALRGLLAVGLVVATKSAFTVLIGAITKAIAGGTILSGILTGIFTGGWLAVGLAIVTGIALAIEDIITYLEGGESYLGNLIELMNQFWLKCQLVWEVIKSIGDGIKNWFSGGFDKIASFLGFGGEMLPAMAGAGNTTNNSSSVKVENMNVYTKATDGKGLATDFKGAINQSE